MGDGISPQKHPIDKEKSHSCHPTIELGNGRDKSAKASNRQREIAPLSSENAIGSASPDIITWCECCPRPVRGSMIIARHFECRDKPENPSEPALDQPCKKRSRCRRSHSAASA